MATGRTVQDSLGMLGVSLAFLGLRSQGLCCMPRVFLGVAGCHGFRSYFKGTRRIDADGVYVRYGVNVAELDVS